MRHVETLAPTARPATHRLITGSGLGRFERRQPGAGPVGDLHPADRLVVWHGDRRSAFSFGDEAREPVIHILPGEAFSDLAACTDDEVTYAYIDHRVIAAVAADMAYGDPNRVDIACGAVEDAVLLALLVNIDLRLEGQGAASADHVIAENLLKAVASHLVARYSAAILRKDRRRNRAEVKDEAFTRAVEFMVDHLDQTIRVEDVAGVSRVSPSRLVSIFEAMVGETPYSYVIRLRLEKAKRLLAMTSEPILQIALDCGFSHQEHLTRHFRKRCATTPAAYRQRQRRMLTGSDH